jgi:hypothetical protein
MKSSGLFPHKAAYRRGNRNSAAGNSEYKHNLPNEDGYEEGSVGWKASRQAGGQSGNNRLAGRPVFQAKGMSGEGGLAWDTSAAKAMTDHGKPDKGGQP